MANLQNTTLHCKGLFSFPNLLSSVPDGALTEASNVVIDRDNIATPRRGFYEYGTSFGNASSRSKQLLVYQNRILNHWGSELDYDSDGVGTFVALEDITTAVANVLEIDNTSRIKYQEASGNLYFTSSQGIRKLSALTADTVTSSPITLAGGIQALDTTASLDSTPGWFVQDSTVAYRVVWGITDANTNVVLGAPSQRVVIYNPISSLIVSDFNRLVTNLAQVAEFVPIVLSGTTHGTSSKLIDGISSTASLSVGMTVSGSTIAASSVIASIPTINSVLLNNNTTGTNPTTTSITFGQNLSNTNYASFRLPSNASALFIYDSLVSLCQELDSDLGVQTYYGLSGNITSITAANPTVVTSVAHGLTTGNFITISNSTSSPIIDGTWQVTVTGVNTFTIPVNVAVAGSTASWISSPASIASNFTTPPITPTPTGNYTTLQTFYDDIVNQLNVDPNIATAAKALIGGYFSNSTQSATVDLTFTVPPGITTAYYYQIYRSALFTSSGASLLTDITPDDELNLIFESNVTAAQITAKSVTYFDDVPDSFRAAGAYLYTNANSGEGITQANTAPPLSHDIAFFKGSTFYSNIQTAYSLELGLLTASGLAGQFIDIIQGNIINRYTFVQNVDQAVTITTVAHNLYTQSGTSDYFDIYTAQNTTTYRVWFQAGTSVAPSGTGVTLVEVTVGSSDTAATIATNLFYEMANNTSFTMSVLSNVVTAINALPGITSAPSNHIANGAQAIVSITGAGENTATQQVGVSNADTPSQQIAETAQSLVRVINQNTAGVIVAQYVSGTTDLPGLMEFQTLSLSAPAFYVLASNNAVSQLFNSDLGTMIAVTNITAANPTHVTATAHGFTTGQTVLFINTNSTPSLDGPQTVTVLDVNTFTVPVNVTVAGISGYVISTANATTSTNEVVPNRLFYSKFQQPEAVPLLNYQDIGPKNKKILRILPLRDSLIILSEAGVYRLSGDSVSNFAVFLSDSSTLIRCADSAVVLNNQVYMVSNQGVVAVSDTGVTIVSRAIENLIIPLLTSQYTSFVPATFAVSYESDRAYLLHTIQVTSDTVSTIAYRYNVLTQTWTSWDITKSCGVVNFLQDIMYYGATDVNSVEIERKQFTRLDQADREYVYTIPTDGSSGNTISLGSLFNVQVGDVFVQTQNLTLSVFNRLLLQLDTDNGLTYKSYSSLSATSGTQLLNSIFTLALQLDADTTNGGYYAAVSGYTTSFSDIQTAFNVITTKLNSDTHTQVKTYPQSIGTTGFESVVSAINISTNVITISNTSLFVAGPIVLYKSIDSSITWAPHHFGDPSMLKQVTEGTILFEDLTFSTATASFNSDLSPSPATIPIFGEGIGTWGGFDWGQADWGGTADSSPFRTFIPAAKQQCRYMNGGFEHNIAFESYAIFGLSLTYRAVSSRAYR